MISHTDDALLEVWEMKEDVYNDFINSKFDIITDFFENEMIEIRIKYHICYRNESESDVNKIQAQN